MTFYDIVVELFGEPQNDMIMYLYYVFGLFLFLYLVKLAFSLVKAMFGIKF